MLAAFASIGPLHPLSFIPLCASCLWSTVCMQLAEKHQPSAVPRFSAPPPSNTETTSTMTGHPRFSSILMAPKPFSAPTSSPRPAPFTVPPKPVPVTTLEPTKKQSQPTTFTTTPRPAPFAPPPKTAPKPVYNPLLAPKPWSSQGGGDSLSDMLIETTTDVRKSARVPSGIGSVPGKVKFVS